MARARSSWIALASCSLILAQCGGSAARDERPNVVLIVADDLDIGLAFDTRRPDTGDFAYPHLRALRERGVLFTNSFVTQAMCSPSRASILTGQYPHNHGVDNNHKSNSAGFDILEREPTLASWLHASGYATAMVGKYINGYGAGLVGGSPRPVGRGWDRWFAVAGMTSYSNWMAARGSAVEAHVGAGEYQTDVLGREAVLAIDAFAAQAKPFFLMLDFVAPHNDQDADELAPTPAERHAGVFDAFEPSLPPSFDEADVSDKPGFYANVSRITPAEVDAIVRRMRARRETMLAVDEALGSLLAKLASEGIAERTVVLFTSDNGVEQGEHRLASGKDWPYEESIRVPLVACGPGMPAGTVRDQMVLNIDLAPTISELARATPQREVDGRSWLALLRDPSTPWRQDFFISGTRRQPLVALRTRTRLLVEYDFKLDGRVDERELYWLAPDERNADADPYELTSLANDARYGDVVETMHARLERLRACRGTSCW